jgi:hypothetical protein
MGRIFMEPWFKLEAWFRVGVYTFTLTVSHAPFTALCSPEPSP